MGGVRNTLGDLNNLLFEQLERLCDGELKDEELNQEIVRSKAVTGIATQIIANGHLVLKGRHLQLEYGADCDGDKKFPRILRADFARE